MEHQQGRIESEYQVYRGSLPKMCEHFLLFLPSLRLYKVCMAFASKPFTICACPIATLSACLSMSDCHIECMPEHAVKL